MRVGWPDVFAKCIGQQPSRSPILGRHQCAPRAHPPNLYAWSPTSLGTVREAHRIRDLVSVGLGVIAPGVAMPRRGDGRARQVILTAPGAAGTGTARRLA